ncbi:hypothetical protein CKA32_006927 [Geitlerinema sp. FC II]|nr:hypothetical protein CKA32_006927 [Geitlerinema sp. FC II]
MSGWEKPVFESRSLSEIRLFYHPKIIAALAAMSVKVVYER